jgi:hypothetical protein
LCCGFVPRSNCAEQTSTIHRWVATELITCRRADSHPRRAACSRMGTSWTSRAEGRPRSGWRTWCGWSTQSFGAGRLTSAMACPKGPSPHAVVKGTFRAYPNKVEVRDADGRNGSPDPRLACASVRREPAGPLKRLHLPLRRWYALVPQVSDSLDIMSRDLPRGDRPEGEKPPDCPVCQAAGLPGYPLVREPAGWWCRRHEGFVELPANGVTGNESLQSP